MEKDKKRAKEPVTQEMIFKIMLSITFGVSAVFLLKNILAKTYKGATVIGICLGVFVVVIWVMKELEVGRYIQQLVLSLALVLLVFVISANSGNYYSDDFPLFLAVIGLAGMYLEPRYTKYQMVFATLALIVLYKINPQKADPLPQYVMCVALFDVAAFIIYMIIKRGRAFIEISILRAEQAEKFLNSIKIVSEELKENYENSSMRIEGMKEVNELLEENAFELKKGSGEISQGTKEVEITCAEAQKRMQFTENSIEALNTEVQNVEEALTKSKVSMEEMDSQMNLVKSTINGTNEVFTSLKKQIKEVSKATKQLTSISNNTKMLALNASIEAVRAGEAGEGFQVVATKVEKLATDSTNCSEQVVDVVNNMQKQINKTSEQLEESVGAINTSLNALENMEEVFDALIKQFESLYKNIGEQNNNVINADAIFGELKEKIGGMSNCSKENQEVVESILKSMEAYKTHMNLIVEDTKHIHELSASMIDVSAK